MELGVVASQPPAASQAAGCGAAARGASKTRLERSAGPGDVGAESGEAAAGRGVSDAGG